LQSFEAQMLAKENVAVLAAVGRALTGRGEATDTG